MVVSFSLVGFLAVGPCTLTQVAMSETNSTGTGWLCVIRCCQAPRIVRKGQVVRFRLHSLVERHASLLILHSLGFDRRDLQILFVA